MIVRPRVLRLAVLCTALAALGLGATATAGANPSTRHATVSIDRAARAAQLSTVRAGVRYVAAKPFCAAPAAGQRSCLALHLVDVAKGTPGAVAYAAPSAGHGPAGGLSPADLASAYNLRPWSLVGSTQTVAIVDAHNDPHALDDLNAFDRHYGLPAETASSFRKVNQYGDASPLPTNSSGWSGEIALDIETARAVCHRCKILLVEAESASSANLATAVNTAARLHATEISNSYGGPERTDPASVVNAYNHPRVVITAATGDTGWYDWGQIDDGGYSDNAPNAPASYPTVVAVGGTRLALNPDGTRQDETVWNGNGANDANGLAYGDLGASGGGCSTHYAAQPWQADVAGYANTDCGSKRLVADVAAVADPRSGMAVYDTYSGGWVRVGGTSLAAPLMAAMWALVGGAGGVQYPARSLYEHFRYSPGTLYDVTKGGNSFCGGSSTVSCSAAVKDLTAGATGNPNNLAYSDSSWLGLLDCGYARDGTEHTVAAATQCNATTGYDGPSGVGSPRWPAALSAGPSVSMTAPSLIRLNTAAAFSATGFSDLIPGYRVASYRWHWGDGKSTSTTSPKVSHWYRGKGTYTVRLAAVDDHGRYSPPVLKVFTVGVPPTVTIHGATTVHRGTTHSWSATAVEPNTGGKIVSRTWRINGSKVGSKVWLKHTFWQVGTYRLTASVADNSGLHATKTITVRVLR
jgi:hypothetical protein